MSNSVLRDTTRLLHHAGLALVIAVASMLLIPNSGKMFFSGDDDDYFAVSTMIAFGQFPSYSKEFHAGEKMPFASVGPGVMAAPFVAIGSIVDHIKKAPISKVRTLQNRESSWALVGFMWASQIYLLAAAFILYALLCIWSNRRAAFYTTILMLIGGGGLFAYAFIRPVMSHVYEFFSITTALWAISKIHFKDQTVRMWLILGIAIAFIFLTRYNNAPISLALIALTVFWAITGRSKKSDVLIMCAVAVALIFIFRVVPVFTNGFTVADQGYLDAGIRLFRVHDFDFYYQRLVQIIFGPDMGIVFTAPALLIAIMSVPFTWRSGPVWFAMLASLLLINVFIAAQWCSAGSFYGYRYFAFTATPLVAIYLAYALTPLLSKISHLSIFVLISFFSLYAVSSLLLFGLKGGFSLDAVQTICGFPSYGNPDYQLNVLRIVGSDPLKVFELSFERSLGGFLERESLDSRGRQLGLLYSFPFVVFFGFLIKCFYNAVVPTSRQRSKGSIS
jgi:hypothetical protein